jgi:hypothetical protein
MHKPAWDEIECLYTLSHIDKSTIDQFRTLKSTQHSHTKREGNLLHYCSFFLPYDQQTGKIYLGHHIKADDWIPPGGHIEPGETPSDAAIRRQGNQGHHHQRSAHTVEFERQTYRSPRVGVYGTLRCLAFGRHPSSGL